MKRFPALLQAIVLEAMALADWVWSEWRATLQEIWIHWGPQFRHVLITVDAEAVRVLQIRGARCKPVAEMSVSDGIESLALDAATLESLAGLPATIGLAGEHAMAWRVRIPKAAIRALAAVVRLKLEREWPLPLSGFCVDQAVVDRVTVKGAVGVGVYIAHRRSVEAMLIKAREWALRPSRIGVLEGSTYVHGNWLAPERRTALLRLRSPVEKWLAVSAGVLAILCVALIGVQWGEERLHVNQETKNLTVRAEAVKRVVAERQRNLSPLLAIRSLLETADATDILAALTNQTPDSTWVFDADIEAASAGVSTLRMTGYSPQAVEYVKTLERSPEFDHVVLTTASSDEARAGRERWQINAQWSGSAANSPATKIAGIQP